MEKQPGIPKSAEEILAEKKEKLLKSVHLMLDWKRSDKIKKALEPQLADLTVREIDYCLKLVRYLDNQIQLRGPLAKQAREALIEDETELKKLGEIIGVKRAKEIVKIFE